MKYNNYNNNCPVSSNTEVTEVPTPTRHRGISIDFAHQRRKLLASKN